MKQVLVVLAIFCGAAALFAGLYYYMEGQREARERTESTPSPSAVEESLAALEGAYDFAPNKPVPFFENVKTTENRIVDYGGTFLGRETLLMFIAASSPYRDLALTSLNHLQREIDSDGLGERMAVAGVTFGWESPQALGAWLEDQASTVTMIDDEGEHLASLYQARTAPQGLAWYLMDEDGLLKDSARGLFVEELRDGLERAGLLQDFHEKDLMKRMGIAIPARHFMAESYGGETIHTTDYRGKNLLLFFISKDMEGIDSAVQGVLNVWRDRDRANLDVLGVYFNPTLETREEEKAWIESQNLPFPVVRQEGLAISNAYYLQGTGPGVVLITATGKVGFRFEGGVRPEMKDPHLVYADLIRRRLQLPETGALRDALGEEALGEEAPVPEPLRLPAPAPEITVKDTRGQLVSTADFRNAGRTSLVLFFSPTCDHCQALLGYVAGQLLPKYEDRGLSVLAVSISQSESKLKTWVEQAELPFAVVGDPLGDLRAAFGIGERLVPIAFLIDAEGNVMARYDGFPLEPTPHYMSRRMESDLRVVMNIAQDPLFAPGEYVGSQACQVCHRVEFQNWLRTPHSFAMDHLVAVSGLARTASGAPAEQAPECLACHSDGYEEPTGFADLEHTRHLAMVGCESCHGPAGEHGIEPRPVMTRETYLTRCAECHTSQTTTNLHTKSMMEAIDHQLEAPPRRALWPVNNRFVGSEACRECHEPEYAQWSTTAHASAFATLPEDRREAPECVACHVTGFEMPGGFSREGLEAELQNVGCESCHGPGSAHIKAPLSKKKQTITSLTDAQDYCLTNRMCTTCHDRANDPNFLLTDALSKTVHGHEAR